MERNSTGKGSVTSQATKPEILVTISAPSKYFEENLIPWRQEQIATALCAHLEQDIFGLAMETAEVKVVFCSRSDVYYLEKVKR